MRILLLPVCSVMTIHFRDCITGLWFWVMSTYYKKSCLLVLSEYCEVMLLKVLLVVLLADQYVDGSERTLYVSELITSYYDMKDMMPVSANNSVCENHSCYSFDHALAKVKSNDVINITTDSTLSFHHILTGLKNVSIIGYNNPTVYCYNTSIIIEALHFNSCTNCVIQGITWSGCGGIIDDTNYPVLEFYDSSNITIENCIFRQSKGQVITFSYTVDVAINKCDFLHNIYPGSQSGAVINIANLEINFTIRNCNFTDNSGTEGIININGQSNDGSLGNISFYNLIFSNNKGPAIYLNHQDLYLYGEFRFIKNTAENGAAMFVTSNSCVYFDQDSSAEFHENTANNSGGAIYLSNSSIISLGQTSKFINNRARDNGGAITLYNNCRINSNFSVLFHNNSATHSGGAVFINHYCSVTFGHNSTFINNTANNGGAMALDDNCGIINGEYSKVTLSFKDNIATQFGGALHLSMYSQASFIQNAKVTFDENSAISSYGSAIFSEFHSDVLFRDNSMVAFYNNFPPVGTLYSMANSTSYVGHNANVTFNNNMARWHYGDEYTESNDVVINASGVVRCSDYWEYYICSKNNKMCSCKHIMNVSSHSEVTITDDLNICSQIMLEGLDSISLTGHNNATIHYKETGELKFMSCQNVEITDLTWNRPSENNPIPKITFSDGSNITVRNCSFQYSMGQSISLLNVSEHVNIDRCKFIYNSDNQNASLIHYSPGSTNNNTNVLTITNCHFSDNEYTQSGLILLEPFKDKSDNVVLHDAEFTDNDGTCIHGNKQNISIKGTVTFKNNKVHSSGAGIFITNNSIVTFCNNSIVSFVQNQAVDANGGAVYLSDHSVMVFESNSYSSFSNNNAMLGGAIYSETNCTISLKGNSSFSSNTAIEGGAIYFKNNSDLKIQNNAYVLFQGNVLRNGRDGSNGGALYLDNYCSVTFEGQSRIIFNKSIVYNGNGGAIYCNRSDVCFTDRCHVTFNDNEVYDGHGGAIFFNHESDAKFQRMSMITFKNNRVATYGGALHFQNSSVRFTDNTHVIFSKNDARLLGGSIYLHENDISFEDNSTVEFNNNYAEHGGALYAITYCTIKTEGMSHVTFNNNRAVQGGAIYFEHNTHLSITGSSKMMLLKNKATENGGSIYSNENSGILFSGSTTIELNNNTATQGGAIYSSESSVVFQSCVTFNENKASKHGGSLYTARSDINFIGRSVVAYNKNIALNGAGGAIYCDNSDILFQERSNITFNENEAVDGGAMHFQFQSNVTFENNSLAIFSNNTATSGGAINFYTNTQGMFGGAARLLFCHNTATTNGGAVYLVNNVSLSFEKAFDNINEMTDTTVHCTDKVLTNSSYIFHQNSAVTGGAIFLTKSEIKFDKNSIIFNGNTATQDGGGIYLSDQSNVMFINDCNVKFSNNSASDYGGAIYGNLATEMGQSTINFNSTNIVFEKNDARIAGDSVYVNLPKDCKSSCLDTSILGNNITNYVITSPNELKLYHPTEYIDRGDNDDECKFYFIDNIMLGQEILLEACMYDYYDKEADAAQFQLVTGNSEGDKDLMLGLNTTFISCNHTVPDIRINAKRNDLTFPHNYSMNITLFVNRLSESKRVCANLTVQLSKCQPGFYYDDQEKVCKCYEDKDIVFCSDSSSTIRRGYWFGEVNKQTTVTFCPINYCNFSCCEASNGYYYLSPIRVDQCRSHRHGTACGNCEEGYILPYDSADCVRADKCTTVFTILVVILTVIYWVVLVVAVFTIMHFQVEIGYLYGLTYYYSIIDILLYQNLEFSNGLFTVVSIFSSIAKVTPQFLGRLCLFKEMSGIDQQFIHYVHPIAFSLILVMISMLTKFSRRLTEFISKVIIPIICFLLLLSYTSIATTSLLLMRPLTFHNIDKVYTYLSPDFEYFQNRHLGYALIAIVSTIAIVIFPPLLLLSEPFLNRKINFVKIKPLLDQFQGCYKDKYRSFAAYYMICRLVIITLIIANSSNDDFMIQYLLISVCVIIALVHLIVRPYANTVINLFDGVVLHIMILVAVLPFVRHYDNFGSDVILALAYILVLLPLTIFMVIQLLIHKEKIMEGIQHVKSFKLSKDKSNNGNNEIPLNERNREFGVIVDESMRRNALIVDV